MPIPMLTVKDAAVVSTEDRRYQLTRLLTPALIKDLMRQGSPAIFSVLVGTGLTHQSLAVRKELRAKLDDLIQKTLLHKLCADLKRAEQAVIGIHVQDSFLDVGVLNTQLAGAQATALREARAYYEKCYLNHLSQETGIQFSYLDVEYPGITPALHQRLLLDTTTALQAEAVRLSLPAYPALPNRSSDEYPEAEKRFRKALRGTIDQLEAHISSEDGSFRHFDEEKTKLRDTVETHKAQEIEQRAQINAVLSDKTRPEVIRLIEQVEPILDVPRGAANFNDEFIKLFLYSSLPLDMYFDASHLSLLQTALSCAARQEIIPILLRLYRKEGIAPLSQIDLQGNTVLYHLMDFMKAGGAVDKACQLLDAILFLEKELHPGSRCSGFDFKSHVAPYLRGQNMQGVCPLDVALAINKSRLFTWIRQYVNTEDAIASLAVSRPTTALMSYEGISVLATEAQSSVFERRMQGVLLAYEENLKALEIKHARELAAIPCDFDEREAAFPNTDITRLAVRRKDINALWLSFYLAMHYRDDVGLANQAAMRAQASMGYRAWWKHLHGYSELYDPTQALALEFFSHKLSGFHERQVVVMPPEVYLDRLTGTPTLSLRLEKELAATREENAAERARNEKEHAATREELAATRAKGEAQDGLIAQLMQQFELLADRVPAPATVAASAGTASSAFFGGTGAAVPPAAAPTTTAISEGKSDDTGSAASAHTGV